MSQNGCDFPGRLIIWLPCTSQWPSSCASLQQQWDTVGLLFPHTGLLWTQLPQLFFAGEAIGNKELEMKGENQGYERPASPDLYPGKATNKPASEFLIATGAVSTRAGTQVTLGGFLVSSVPAHSHASCTYWRLQVPAHLLHLYMAHASSPSPLSCQRSYRKVTVVSLSCYEFI